MTKRGRFITIEGMDGAGKSTHLQWIADRVRATGRSVTVTREPGGTVLGEKLRALLLAEAMHVDTETMLMFASRNEHIAQVIGPALASGQWVISDRFTDATFAYQGGGRGLSSDRLKILEHWVQGELQPDHTLYFDLPVELARERLAASQADLDRFEREGPAFFFRVRKAYLDRAAADPGRIHVIDASRSISDIQKSLDDFVISYC